jgi:hypothetical protein
MEVVSHTSNGSLQERTHKNIRKAEFTSPKRHNQSKRAGSRHSTGDRQSEPLPNHGLNLEARGERKTREFHQESGESKNQTSRSSKAECSSVCCKTSNTLRALASSNNQASNYQLKLPTGINRGRTRAVQREPSYAISSQRRRITVSVLAILRSPNAHPLGALHQRRRRWTAMAA